MSEQRCYYDILGVQRGADQAAIKSAFRKMAKQCHPDMGGGCEHKFKEVNEAYAILSDPDKRARYDQFGRAGLNGNGAGPGYSDFSDIFNEVFGEAFGDFFGRGGAAGRRGPARGADLRFDLEITLEEAYAGVEREIAVPGAQTCEPCHGTGGADGAQPETCPTCGGAGQVRATQGMFRMVRTCPACSGSGRVIRNPCKACAGHGVTRKMRKLAVKIPAGVEDGTRIRLAGEGDAAGRGGHPGDLYIFLSLKPHPLFERDGADLYCRAPVPMCKAALGGEVEIPTIDGGPATVTIPEGAQTGRRIRLKNLGMTSLRGGSRGDLHVELVVETPVKLSAKQRKLLEEFAATCTADAHPQSHGFFNQVKSFFEQKAPAQNR